MRLDRLCPDLTRGMDLSPFAREARTMEHDISDILLISISLCFIIGGSIFAAMVLGMEYGVLEIPYGPYILLVIAIVIVILAGLIVITGTDDEKEM
jgi:TRAP-type C4-dicarboxylate transport system permease small subunit